MRVSGGLRWGACLALLMGSEPLFAEPCPATARAVIETVTEAESSFEAMDLPAFTAAVARADQLLACVGQPLSRSEVAHLHRARGLSLFVSRDLERAALAFAAARAIEPGYTFPPELLPAGHPAQVLYTQRPAQSETLRVAQPAAGSLLFDGLSSQERPVALPTLLQRVDDAGVVVETRYLWPEETPSWMQPAVAGGADGRRREVDAGKIAAWSLGSSALVAGVSAVSFYAVARSEAAEYWDPQTSAAELDGLRAQVNAHQGVAVGSAVLGAALGLGATIVVVWN